MSAVFRFGIASKRRAGKTAMRFTALQDPCGQWMVYDLWSDCPAQIPDRALLGLTREEAEELAGKANEFLSTPRSVMFSRYLKLLSICQRPNPETSDSVPSSVRVAEARSSSRASSWSKPRLRVVQRSP
ncbi:hypothetical protein MPLDJ20_270133 [Mesorhizobium plurifarium]|uniref:Uncharacterized protein n=1 Tax=Mesorhizobium plurifarium TaxID=69974 RepID=A0A090F958_MESPL|nr:hypothetical protein MPLDJ20_270133 [Mesorhizobium plurifarium]